MNEAITQALVNYLPLVLPEAVLGVFACLLFLGATFCRGRNLWGGAALVGLGLAAAALVYTAVAVPTIGDLARDSAAVYAAPVVNTRLALFFKALALAGALVLVLTSWNEVSDELAAEFHACLLLVTAGVCLTGAANELITLFLSLELISIPTYILLYLPRSDARRRNRR